MPTPVSNSKEARDFERLVTWASAVSIAITAGFLASLEQVNPAVRFRFSAASVVAFFAGGILTVVFFRIVLRSTDRRRRAVLVTVAAVAAVVGYFLLGIKNVSRETRTDVTIGTVIAIAALTFVGWMLWRVAGFLESDRRRNDNNPE